MSFGGILATALAGGAQVVGKQAGDDIEAGRKTDLMREQAAIEEAMRMRLAEFNAGVDRTAAKNKLLDTRDFNASDATIAAKDKIAQADGKTARGVKLAEATDTELNDALLANKTKEAKVLHDAKVEETIRDSGNPSLLKAMADIENASPSKRAETNLKNAQAYQANQHGNYFKAAGAAAGTKGDGKPEKMDEAAKIQYQALFGEVKAALAHQAKFEAEGQPFDGNNQPTQQYKLVQGNVAKAQRQLSAFQMRNGLLDPEELARQAVAGETDSAKIGTAIAQAYSQGGSEFGDKFFAAVRNSGALERNANNQSAKPAAPEKKAALLSFSPGVEIDPANSPAGKFKARNAAAAQREGAEKATKEQQAMAAFESVTDAATAYALQNSPLFSYLSLQQKSAIYKKVNGR